MKKKKWIGIGIVLVLVFVVIAAVINVIKGFRSGQKKCMRRVNGCRWITVCRFVRIRQEF